jgi:DNA-binding transcriptional LysR family regulator
MLTPRMPDLAALETLVTVARTGSLNAAARELGRTQQAVSARMSALEAQTGVVLTSRTARGSALTPSGVVVADWAARLLDLAGEVDAGIAALRQDRHAHLVIAASLTVAERLLPSWLVTLRSRSGTSDVEVTLAAVNSTEAAEQVRSGAADLGFVEGPSAPKGCRTRVVADDELVVVVADGHPWATRRAPLTAAELAATPLVTREPGSGTRGAFETALRRRLGAGAALARPALELPTTAAIRTTVLGGSAPAVLSRLVVADDLATGRLRAVPVPDLDLRRALRAIWAGARTPPAGPARDLVAIAAAGIAGRS